MGFLQRFFSNKRYTLPEHLQADRNGVILTPNTFAGVNVTEKNAEQITAVYSCLRVKFETMAAMKTRLMERDGNNIQPVLNNLNYLLSTEPNPNMSDYDYWATIQLHEDTWGNAFSYIHRDRSARPEALEIWMPWEVDVMQDTDGSIWYKHKGETYPAADVLHFRQNSINGLMGRSVIKLQREVLGLAKKQENYASKIFGEKPQAVMESDQMLKSEQADQIAKIYKSHTLKGLIPIIPGGAKYKSIVLPPGDAQYTESKQFVKSDIYGMFRMPPYKVQNYSKADGATYSNVEQQAIAFVSDVVHPSVRSKESECNRKLIGRSNRGRLFVQFDLSELMLTDFKARKEFFEAMLTRGVYSRNEVRKKLGDNPINVSHDPNGDRHFIQAGFIPADRADDFINGKTPEETAREFLINGRGKKLNGNHSVEA